MQSFMLPAEESTVSFKTDISPGRKCGFDAEPNYARGAHFEGWVEDSKIRYSLDLTGLASGVLEMKTGRETKATPRLSDVEISEGGRTRKLSPCMKPGPVELKEEAERLFAVATTLNLMASAVEMAVIRGAVNAKAVIPMRKRILEAASVETMQAGWLLEYAPTLDCPKEQKADALLLISRAAFFLNNLFAEKSA